MARILLVEDDPALWRGIIALLRAAGHAADCAKDGETALTNIANRTAPFVSGQPLTTDTATYDIIGRTYYVGFKAKF